MGIYVGYLGLFADVFMLAVLLLEKRISILRNYGVIIVFAVALLGFIYHDYLTYVAITRIGKLCIWCLTEHTIMTILLDCHQYSPLSHPVGQQRAEEA